MPEVKEKNDWVILVRGNGQSRWWYLSDVPEEEHVLVSRPSVKDAARMTREKAERNAKKHKKNHPWIEVEVRFAPEGDSDAT